MIIHTIPDEWRRSLLVISAEDSVESRASFDSDELLLAGSFRVEKRRAEWFSSRLAAKMLACTQSLATGPLDVRVVMHGRRPLLMVGGSVANANLSISHSHGLAAAVVDTRRVGVDIEKKRVIAPRATRFYLHDEELASAQASKTDTPLIHLWAAKEAAWKISNPPTVRFIRITILESSEQGMKLRYATDADSDAGEISTFVTNGDYAVAIATSDHARRPERKFGQR